MRPLTIAPTTDYDAGTVLVSYRPGRRGQRPTVSTVPAAAIKGLTLSNRATTSGSATRIAISRRSDSRTITVTGHVRAGSSGGSVQIAVGSPHLVAAAVFRDELRKAGVAVSGSTRVRSVPARRADGSGAPQRVALDRSMTLAQLLVPFLKLSNNSHAEALTKTLGRVAGGAGSWSAGTTVTPRYLARSGVPLAGVRLVDGSGLSRSDRLTTRATVALLARVTREPWFAAYSAALPVAGDSRRMVGGTLRSRMTGTAAAGNARAKTGSLTGVTGLSGYVRGADGRRYAFSMISAYSTRTPRPVEDRLVVTLARWRR
ncbi:PBP4 family serine-type D-alanyl-D-alanine carboxypeptidase [Friedmanniella endophytica]|uniref:PBP4 family serine-type D-alanyl-D-alanine carboxypeptidase n=1 Tax=Microlunatus kandeliicorticis TaxID=1759536 RepID=A0A7W3ISK2_9ACTN|nr:PBP4 family serine-type D-alanyl-D-alanine carboxypeptidase [Microlunatus kandeliicorticis]